MGTISVPSIQKPTEGESYNPTEAAHTSLQTKAVDLHDQMAHGIKRAYVVKDTSKRLVLQPKGKVLTKKEKKYFAEMKIKKDIKAKKNMEYNFGKYLKEAKIEKKVKDVKLQEKFNYEKNVLEKIEV